MQNRNNHADIEMTASRIAYASMIDKDKERAIVEALTAERDAANAKLTRSEAELAKAMEALDTIGRGMTNKFPGAPNPMTTSSPLQFRSAMWEWSQRVARSVISASTERKS